MSSLCDCQLFPGSSMRVHQINSSKWLLFMLFFSSDLEVLICSQSRIWSRSHQRPVKINNLAIQVSNNIRLILCSWVWVLGLFHWLSSKESTCQSRRCGFDPWVEKIPWRRKWQPAPVFLCGKFRGLVGYSPWGHKELDTTERLSMST